MKHPARWIASAVAVVLVALVVVLASQIGSDPREDATKSHLAGKDVPKFRVTTLDGERLTKADLAGKVTIVNFWNTWCIPCRQEAPALQEFYAKHADDPNFVMLGIVRDDTRAAVDRWVRNRGDEWTIAMDEGGSAALAFGTRGQPETFAISPDGLIVGYQFGPSSVADLEALRDAAAGGTAQ